MAVDLERMDEEQLRQAAKLLERENERLVRRVVELQEQLSGKSSAAVQQELAHLEQQLAQRNKQLFGDSSEKRRQARKALGKHKRKGHGPREQKELGLVEKVHELDVADRVCTQCGGELSEFVGQFEQSEEVDVLRRQFVRVLHKRKKYRCGCGGCVETALGPDKLQQGGRYSTDFAVHVAVDKYANHLPLERQVKMMRREGLRIDSQTLWDQVDALAHRLEPLHERLHAHVLSHPVVGADETYWRLMGSKHGPNKRWQTWAVVSDKAAYYTMEDTRGVAAANKLLEGYSGTVLCDGYGGYASLKKRGGDFALAHCWAHVRRKYIECEDQHPQACGEVLNLIGQLYALEKDVQTDDERRRIRNDQSRDVVDKIHQWALRQTPLPQSPLGKAIAYMGKLWPGLLRFLDDPKLALDNNGTERALRGVVLGRKNHYGSRSERGTYVAALMYSLIETAKLQDVDPHAYLKDVATAAIRGEQLKLPHETA